MRTALLAALALIAGCAAHKPENDIDRLVTQAVSTQPATPDEAMETLLRTDRAIDTSLRIIACNVSNAQTIGYKANRVHHLGNGEVSIALDVTQGALESTGLSIDVGIQGAGFIPVKIMSNAGNGIGYTRNGNFFRNSQGDLIVNVGDGYQLVPPINLPPDVPSENVSIGTDGKVEYIRPGTSTKILAGQIQLANFPNPQGLRLLGGSVYQETDGSGPALTGNPGDNGTGTLMSGFLEASNVDLPFEELRRITALRWRTVIDRSIARIDPR